MELSCGLPPSPDVVRHVEIAEQLGYRRAWIFDSPALYGDIWVQLALCAQATSTIGLGTAVLVPSLRHPMVNAAAIAQLDQLAPGRLAVALGTGFTGRYVLGQKPMKWADVELYLRQLISLLKGDAVEIDGRKCQMIHPAGDVSDRPIDVPIVVAANGPKGLAVAEAIEAAGVMSIFGPQAGWEWSSLFGYGTVLEPGEAPDSPRALAAAGPGGAVVFHGMYEADPTLLDGMPGGPEWRADVEQYPADERHLRTHEGHFVHMTARDGASVTGDMLTGMTWTGEAEALKARMAETEAAGVSEFLYAPMGPDVGRELEAFRQLVD
jgi:5,10-methylenetetrahydromethanopterin reductase